LQRVLAFATTGTLIALSPTSAVAGIPTTGAVMKRRKLGHWGGLITIHPDVATTLKSEILKMFFQIKEIILWPRSPLFRPPRSFAPGK